MGSVETIAWIMVIAGAIKIISIAHNPKGWMNFAKKIWSKPQQMKLAGVVLGVIVLYYLLQELTIIQIMATMAFFAALLMVGFASDAEPLLKKYEKQIKNKTIWAKHKIYILIWIVLMVWTLKELLA